MRCYLMHCLHFMYVIHIKCLMLCKELLLYPNLFTFPFTTIVGFQSELCEAIDLPDADSTAERERTALRLAAELAEINPDHYL